MAITIITPSQNRNPVGPNKSRKKFPPQLPGLAYVHFQSNISPTSQTNSRKITTKYPTLGFA